VAGGTLTVRELVEETDLGLRLVAGFASKDRLVTGVHVSEMPDPTRWLAPRIVLLSTGIIMKDDPGLGLQLVRRLAAADTAALGVDPHLYMGGSFPEGMIEEAERLAFPLFSIPLATPFRAITGYVHSSLLSRDFHRLRRSLSLQNHLLGQLLEDRGVGPLISSLAMLLATTAVLFDRSGQVIAEAQGRARLTEAGLHRIWALYAELRPENVEREGFLLGEYRVEYREVRHRGRVEQLIAIVRPRNQPLPESTDVILSYAEKLLTLDLLRSQDSLLLRKRMQSSLLDELVAGGGHTLELAERARHYGLDPDRPWRVVAIAADETVTRDAFGEPLCGDAAPEPESDFLAVVDEYLSQNHPAYLSVGRPGGALVLLSCSCNLTELRAELAGLCAVLSRQSALGAASVGVSEEYSGVEMIPLAREQAREALRAASPKRLGPGVHAFADLGPRARVLENQSPDRLQGFYDSTIRPLADYDRENGTELLRSLETYLDLDRSVSDTAARLFVHRNTLRNRLQKVEELLGLRVDSTEAVVDLYLGFKAHALLAGTEDGPRAGGDRKGRSATRPRAPVPAGRAT
jgi:PucR family transcriptional regulator, purine catabolism regulatory protein